ncbi:MAG: hypothetical protein QOG03_576 [Actinomycetota bacterium]|jgi:hypothetical protein|nr:hypothetical protein [Actinomycetota bacterium]
MDFILAAKVWHYWIGVLLVGVTVLALIGVGLGYLVKVSSQKYPRR